MVYCKICSKTTINDNELCKVCQNKRKAAHIILTLQDKVNFKENITKTKLFNIGYTDVIRLEDLIWTLNETNVIKKINNEEYQWVNLDLLKKFVEKYDEKNGHDFKINEIVSQENQDNCMYCGKSIPKTSKKKKICKECKKTRKTLKNIKFIDSFADALNMDEMIQETSKEEYQIEGIIFDLIENDLIKKIDEKDYQKIPENIEQYLKEHDDINNKINNSKKKKIDNNLNKTDLSNDEIKENVEIFVTDEEEVGQTINTIKNSDIQSSESLFIVSSDEPNISFIEPAGWVLYKVIEDNKLHILEYDELNGVSKPKLYHRSKVYALKDFENVKWIKDINRYYTFTEDTTTYKNATVYTSQDIEKEIQSSQMYESEVSKTSDMTDSLTQKEIVPSNNEIFDEFFDKHIQISEDEKSWITYDELLKIFTEYSHIKYQIKIPELGENGFNQLLYSKIKKISGIKTNNVNSTMEFNLIFDKESKLNDDVNSTTINNAEFENKIPDENNGQITNNELSVTQIVQVNRLLAEYLNKNMKILPRTANTGDITQEDIYNLFTKYLETKNRVIDYPLFSYSFQNVVSNTNGINKLIERGRVYYNFEYINQEINPRYKSESIPKNQKVEDLTSKLESIKSNPEIFDEFFEKHLEITTDVNWIQKQRLYKLFNNYALNKYNVEIAENGLDGFNSILQSKNKKITNLEKRIRNGKIEYNLKYIPNKENIEKDKPETDNNKNEKKSDNKDNIDDIELKRLEEYFENYIQILDKKVDENDITKRHIYNHYRKYHQKEYGEDIAYIDFKYIFIKVISKYSNINTIVDGTIVHYNIEIINTSESEEKEIIEDNVEKTVSENKPNKELFDEFWNKHILILKHVNEGQTTAELYDYYKEFSKNENNINIKNYGLEGFNYLFLEKLKEYKKDINFAISSGKLRYNLKYVEDVNTIDSTEYVSEEENTDDKKILTNQTIIPENIKEYFNNKTTKELETSDELIIIYNDIVSENEYLPLMELLTNTKDYLNKINISRITDEELNVNIEFIFEKHEIENNSSLKIKEDTSEKISDKENNGIKKYWYSTNNDMKKYTLKDHIYLKPENPSYNLFYSLDEKISEIDENITIEVLKKIIGYKINERFVYLHIHKSSLTVCLNIPINTVVDPRNICREITNKGTWKNGLIDFKVYDVNDIGYAMNLIIQAYEYTLNNN